MKSKIYSEILSEVTPEIREKVEQKTLEIMKPTKENSFLDLSKLSEDQQRTIFKVLIENKQLVSMQLSDIFSNGKYIEFNFYSLLFLNQWNTWQVENKLHNLQELTYTQFIEMMEESTETDEKGQPLTFWGGKATSKEVLQVENKNEISFETEYQLEEWRKIQPEYFDENGEFYSGVGTGKYVMEIMLKTIDQLEKEIKDHLYFKSNNQ